MITKINFKENHKFKKLLKFDLNNEEAKIIAILESYGITNYIINDGIVDVNEDVYLRYENLTEIPFKFGIVKGYFICSRNNLTSLQGAPTTVKGSFNCSNNPNLTSLQYAPTTVGGDFNCSYNNLTSLQGAPTAVRGYFDCSNNPNLTSLQGVPTTVEGSFFCLDNPKLLETYGSKEGIINYIKANCEVDGEIYV